MINEKQLEFEITQEKLHNAALRVCELIADGSDLKSSCELEGISISKFFQVKRDNPDVAKSFVEAKEISAEVRLAKLDDYKEQLLSGEIDKDIYSAVIKSEQWIITKLRPDLFGTRTSVQVSGLIEHSPAKALSNMTDEQILAIANLSPARPSSSRTPAESVSEKEDIIDAEYEEDKINIDNEEEIDYIKKQDGDLFSPKNSFPPSDSREPEIHLTADNAGSLDLSMFGG